MAKKSAEGLVLSVAELEPILRFAGGFASDRDLVPGLKQLWFSGAAVRASTGSAGVVCTLPQVFPDALKLVLPAADLVQLVGSLRAQGHEEIRLDFQGAAVQLRGGGFKALLQHYRPGEREDVSAYLLRDVPSAAGRVPLTRPWWTDVGRLAFTVCRDETKAPLRGVFWAGNGMLFSTDTYRISAVLPEKAHRAVPPTSGGLLLPDHLLERLGADRRDEVSALGLEGATTVWCFLERAAAYGLLPAGDFPVAGCADRIKKVRGEVRDKTGTWVGLPEGTVMPAVLDRLLYFAAAPTFRLGGEVTADSLRLSVVAEGTAEAEEVIPARVEGPPVSFFVNGKYLREAVEAVGPRFWVPPAGGSVLYCVSADRRLEHLVLLLVA